MRLALALALAACSTAPSAPPVVAPPPPAVEASEPVNATLLANARQLVVGVVDDWDDATVTLQLWQRDGQVWRAVETSWVGVVGTSGTAWGIGLHGDGPPAGRAGQRKVEGDGRSPAGAFSLVASYGYLAAPPAGTTLPYQTTTRDWKCVDDPASSSYNRVFDAAKVTKDWKTAEEMRREDMLYAWVVEVAHNPTRTPQAGSCIFLHVWSGEKSTTSGCTAMKEEKLAWLMSKLDVNAKPVLVLLPKGEYEALAGAWGLPPL